MTTAAEYQQHRDTPPSAVGCETCGSPVPPRAYPGGQPKRFCSDACRHKSKNHRPLAVRQRQQQPSLGAVGRKRRPLPDAANDAAWALRKDIERLERIVADSRFGENKEKVAPLLRGHLSYTAQACQDLISRITPQQEG